MLTLSNMSFNGSVASVTHTSDSPIQYAAVQLCIQGGQCLWSRTWYDQNNHGPTSGTSTYTFTQEDHNTIQPNQSYELKFWFMNTGGMTLDNVQEYLPINPMLGDINYDGTVNVVDVVQMVSAVLGTNTHPLNTHLMDMNTDGNIDVVDVVRLVTNVLGPQSAQGQQIINQVRGNRATRRTPQRPRGPVQRVQETGRGGKPLSQNRNKLVNNHTTLIRNRTGKGDEYIEAPNPRYQHQNSGNTPTPRSGNQRRRPPARTASTTRMTTRRTPRRGGGY